MEDFEAGEEATPREWAVIFPARVEARPSPGIDHKAKSGGGELAPIF